MGKITVDCNIGIYLIKYRTPYNKIQDSMCIKPKHRRLDGRSRVRRPWGFIADQTWAAFPSWFAECLWLGSSYHLPQIDLARV